MLLLHLSDIHFRAPHCLEPNLDPDHHVRTLMLHDIRDRVHELGPVNAILIGGDIAFKGAPAEYETATHWVHEIVDVAQCPLTRVFVVPGNHDVDRTIIQRTPAVQNTQAAIVRPSQAQRPEVFRTQISDPDTAQSLLAPIAAYNDFAKSFNCQVYLPERLYWKQDIKLEDNVVLRVHGLTSTLLSGANGQDDTRESLYLSPLQTVLVPLPDVVNLVLSHHPPDWFMDQDDADDAICARAAIHMFGHKHRQRITREAGYVRFGAAAVNPDPNEPGWQPGYNLVDMHVTGTGRARSLSIAAHLRQLQSNPAQFRATLTPQGEEVFRHSIPFPGPQHTCAPAGILAPTPATPDTEPAATATVVGSVRDPDPDVEAAMGDANTRNLVFRFWNLTSSQRREIMLRLQLITPQEVSLPEPERYGRGLIRAGKRQQLAELAHEVAQKEST